MDTEKLEEPDVSFISDKLKNSLDEIFIESNIKKFGDFQDEINEYIKFLKDKVKDNIFQRERSFELGRIKKLNESLNIKFCDEEDKDCVYVILNDSHICEKIAYDDIDKETAKKIIDNFEIVGFGKNTLFDKISVTTPYQLHHMNESINRSEYAKKWIELGF